MRFISVKVGVHSVAHVLPFLLGRVTGEHRRLVQQHRRDGSGDMRHGILKSHGPVIGDSVWSGGKVRMPRVNAAETIKRTVFW